MLSVYSNKQELLKATNTTKALRLESSDLELIDKRDFSVTFTSNNIPNLELHVYTPDGSYLYGNHNTNYSIEDNTGGNRLAYKHISVNTVNVLDALGVNRGSYKLIYNLFNNVVGGFDSQKLWIKEISPSRRELRLQLTDYKNSSLVNQYQNFKSLWEAVDTNDVFQSFVLNFGFNETYQIINVKFDSQYSGIPEIIVRLYNPLPAKFGEKAKLWISEEIIQPVLDSVVIIPKQEPEPVTNLAPPNFDLEEYDGFSVATSFKSWNDLLSNNVQTSQQIIDNYFSGSLSGIKLNINYRSFSNFVHYSSAVERVSNFKYKLELIEHYNYKLQEVLNISASTNIQSNLLDLYSKRNRIVSGFDDFEKYLFFESTGSKLYSHNDLDSGSIDPWPKKTSSVTTWQTAWPVWSTYYATWSSTSSDPDPYNYFLTIEPTTSDVAVEYYNNLLEIAETYDRFNIHKLLNTIPGHLLDADQTEDFSLFVNMLGQHFDILWTYISHLSSIHTREEHPKDGMPSDLLWHVAESMGFSLLNGKSTSELWKYSLGVDESGVALQESVDGIKSIPDSEHTKEIWRRIVNNLPYILKTKGTSRSIKALLTCFGIPTTVLTIREYGGPTTYTDLDHFPEYNHEVFHYAWLSTTGSLLIPSRSYTNSANQLVRPDSLEFRFKTDNNFTYNVNSPYVIFQTSGSSLTVTKETADDNQGTLTLSINGKSGSIGNLEIFDNSWHQVVVETSNSSGSLRVARSLYGNLIYLHSASFATGSGIPAFNTNLTFASGSNKLFGHFQEIRLWSGSLTDNTIIDHAASPGTYTFNVDRNELTTGTEASRPYDHLLQRYTLSNTKIYSGSFYQRSSHPNQTINTGSIFFEGYTDSGSIDFEGFEETYYTPSPSLGASTLFTNKVRIESSSLDPNRRLNLNSRIERSSFDRYSLDSNKIGIYFSPQTSINEDIFNQLGYFEIDDYIGNPGDLYNDHYTDLNNFAINYWKKYDNRNDFEAYFRALQIYDFTLFKYIKRLLPYRVDLISGLAIEPNVLERSKVKLLNKPVIEDLLHETTIANTVILPDVSSDYQFQEAQIENVSPDISSEVFDNLTDTISNLTDINKLDYNWVQHRYVGKYKITESGSYVPLQIVITDSRPSILLKEKKEITTSTSIYATAGYQTGSASERSWGDVNNAYTSDDIHVSSSVSLTTHVTKWLAVKDYIVPSLHKDSKIIGIEVNVESNQFGTDAIFYQAGFSFTSGSVDVIKNSDESNKTIALVDTINSFYFTTDYPVSKYNIGNLQTFIKCKNTTNSASTPRIDQIYATLYYKTPGTGSASVQEYVPIGIQNQRYNGCKLTGPGINIDTPNTIDGGPVVKVTEVSPNQIIFANNQITTIDQAVTGKKNKSI